MMTFLFALVFVTRVPGILCFTNWSKKSSGIASSPYLPGSSSSDKSSGRSSSKTISCSSVSPWKTSACISIFMRNKKQNVGDLGTQANTRRGVQKLYLLQQSKHDDIVVSFLVIYTTREFMNSRVFSSSSFIYIYILILLFLRPSIARTKIQLSRTKRVCIHKSTFR